MSIVNQEIISYINEISPMPDGVLGDIQKEGLKNNMPIIPLETAGFISSLLSIIRPESILEIGCAIGFSAGLMSRYLAENGHITTIDRYDIMIKEAKINFKKLGIEDKVTLLEGDAMEILSSMEGSFDFIFLDAAKGQYINMLPHCLRLLKAGGVMVADDCFQNGNIAKSRLSVQRRQRTIHTRMRVFLETVCNTRGLNTSLIPIGDGIALIHKTMEWEK